MLVSIFVIQCCHILYIIMASKVYKIQLQVITEPSTISYVLRVKLKQEGVWGDVDLVNSSILEIFFPVDTIVIKRPITDEMGSNEPIGYQAIVLDPSPECTAQLLALAVDHIDILLEDWYPTLGEWCRVEQKLD